MTGTIGREVVVAVLGAAAVGAATLAWNWGTSGGAIRALGGVTTAELEATVKRLALSGSQGPKGDPGQQGLPGKDGLLPGAVVAFAIEDGCPPGWSIYSNAIGRVIVGVGQGEGLTKRSYLAQGGNEYHKITVNNLPERGLNTNGYSAIRSRVDRYSAGGAPYPVIIAGDGVIQTEVMGKGESFQLMPPFINLHYCRKTS